MVGSKEGVTWVPEMFDQVNVPSAPMANGANSTLKPAWAPLTTENGLRLVYGAGGLQEGRCCRRDLVVQGAGAEMQAAINAGPVVDHRPVGRWIIGRSSRRRQVGSRRRCRKRARGNGNTSQRPGLKRLIRYP